METDGEVFGFLTYQQKLMSSVSHHAVTVAEKSRRTGYSWALGAIAVLTAAAAKKPLASSAVTRGTVSSSRWS